MLWNWHNWSQAVASSRFQAKFKLQAKFQFPRWRNWLRIWTPYVASFEGLTGQRVWDLWKSWRVFCDDEKPREGRKESESLKSLLSPPRSGLKGITGSLFTEEKQMPHYTERIRAWEGHLCLCDDAASASESWAERHRLHHKQSPGSQLQLQPERYSGQIIFQDS